MAADLAAVLADPNGPADLVNIAGVDLLAIRQPASWIPAGEIEGAQVEREVFFLLQERLGFVPVPWSELLVDGRRWSVEAVPEKGLVLELVLVRYGS